MPSMMFSPNLTGALHVASGIVLWLTAKEAKASGAKLMICLDEIPGCIDTPGQARQKPSVQSRIDTLQSTMAACELLGIEPDAWHFRATYMARYLEVLDMLKCCGAIYEVEPTTWMPVDVPCAQDRALGPIGNEAQQVIKNYALAHPFCALVDWWDFDVRLHIRGADIFQVATEEVRLWPTIEKVLGKREMIEYAHIPVIARADCTPLHKSDPIDPSLDRTRVGMADDPYSFETWAAGYKTVEERREALERIVLRKDAPYALENLIPRRKVTVCYNPDTGETTYNQEKTAVRRVMQRRGLWVDY